MARKVPYILERIRPSMSVSASGNSARGISCQRTQIQNRMKNKIVSVLAIVLLGLHVCSVMGWCADKPTSVPAEAPDMAQVRQNLEKRLAAAVKNGDAQASQQWAQALAAMDSSEFLVQQTAVSAPVAGLFKAFSPQMAAIPTLIKNFMVGEMQKSMTTPRFRELFGKFFGATSAEESIPLAHGLVQAGQDEMTASRLFWEYRNDDKAFEAFAKSIGAKEGAGIYDVTDAQREQWERVCRERASAAVMAASTTYDPEEAAKMEKAQSAAQQPLLRK